MRFRFYFVVFFITAILLFTVFLRSTDNRIFYKLCKVNAELGQLKQQLGKKQLELENLISPSAVSEFVEE